MLHQATTDLYKQGHFPSFNHHLGIEQDLTLLSNVFEEVEYLGCTIIPLPHAQADDRGSARPTTRTPGWTGESLPRPSLSRRRLCASALSSSG